MAFDVYDVKARVARPSAACERDHAVFQTNVRKIIVHFLSGHHMMLK